MKMSLNNKKYSKNSRTFCLQNLNLIVNDLDINIKKNKL